MQIRGYHVYSDIWNAVIDEELPCAKEFGNLADPFAVGVMKDGTVVGHVPRKISSVCSLFLQRSGSIVCRVTGPRRFSADSIASYTCAGKKFHRFLFSHTLHVFETCENLHHSKISRYMVCPTVLSVATVYSRRLQ